MGTSEEDRVILQRLMFAKRMYLHGVEHSEKQDSFARAIAIHHFHAAAETAAKALLLRLGIRTKKSLNIEFEVMLTEVDQHLKSRGAGLPLRQEMRNLNTVRNLIQHHAYEGVEKVDEMRYFTRAFLDKVYQDCFGLAFERLSLGDLIHSEEIRTRIKEAEEYMGNGDYLLSAAACSIAFQESLRSVRKPYERDTFFSPFFVASGLREVGLDRHVEAIVREINDLQEIMALLCLDINFAAYTHFQRLVPDCYQTLDGTNNWYIAVPEGREWTAAEVWSIYNFVIDALLRWQDVDLLSDTPFVRTHLTEPGSFETVTYEPPDGMAGKTPPGEHASPKLP